MRTAHQSVPAPQLTQEAANKGYVDSSIAAIPNEYKALFKWNHSNVSQFTLTDPSAHGWSVSFVAATTSKAEHIRVTAPTFVGSSRAYLVVSATLSSSNFECIAVHNFFNFANTQYVYALSRASNVTTGIYAGARWEQPAGVLTGVYNATLGDQIIAQSLEFVPSGATPQDYIVETQSSVRSSVFGKGWGKVANYGNIDYSTEPSLLTSAKAGMGFVLNNPTAQIIEIYDFIVYQRKS